MKYKGLWIGLAVVGILAIIGSAVFLGFFLGRRMTVGTTFSFNRPGFTFPYMGRGMNWPMHDSGCDDDGLTQCSRNSFENNASQVISVEDAELAVDSYIDEYYADSNLHIGEIMVFDNHAYAVVQEEDTGINAFEVLVDSETLIVTPEMGPNMMWNLKYGHMQGGMMNNGINTPSADMPVTEEEALQLANAYLQSIDSNLIADGHPDQFYGYYTIHTSLNGVIYGMLSVNGYSGEVFLHTWHGQFIEMTEHSDDH
ncbi:MAG: hypothetical protein H0S79_06945 [Anaerolineaceae bacterium]|nr:hypothetical protein [Anaerolineaceae bacterium]